MNQFKRAQVIMLPTQLNTCNLVPIIKYINGKLQYLNMEFTNNSLIGQHLYIISDDEIKEGDWILLPNKRITQIPNNIKLKIPFNNFTKGYSLSDCKKIIATTDTSLKRAVPQEQLGEKFNDYYPLPKPSQQFIEKYIEFYNKGEVITDVLVEYEWIDCLYHVEKTTRKKVVKTNYKDNTITIKKLKDIWNREEVINLLTKQYTELVKEVGQLAKIGINMEPTQFIEENL